MEQKQPGPATLEAQLDVLRTLVAAHVPKGTPDAVEASNALRAIAFALESQPGAALPRFFLELPDGDDRKARVVWSERKADGYHLCITVPPAPFPADLGAKYGIEFDGFKGTVIGAYKRLDGEEGVVMQQDGTKVVHVYRRKWLQPA